MKRQTRIPAHNIYRIWPRFFWRMCEVCDYEFRREYGWKKLGGNTLNGVGGEWKYVCKWCCETIGSADKELPGLHEI